MQAARTASANGCSVNTMGIHSLGERQGGQRLNNPDRLYTDLNHLADPLDDRLWLFEVIGIVDDATPGVGFDLVLLNDPFQRRTVAQSIVKGFRGNAVERQPVVVNDYNGPRI